MRVVDIINAADAAKVEAEYRRAYSHEVAEHGEKTWATAANFRQYQGIVNGAVGVVKERMTVVIKYIQGADEEEADWYDVSGRLPNEDTPYALEFTPWGEWKLMEVEYPDDLDVHQAACHLYYEMTWCGWPEQIQQRFDTLMDLKEEAERDLAGRNL
ncbi:DUF6557 family protein [Tsuneonella sp. CC-YZS046]|uniref:DUF6557 family protein n=1 Tax=Tsuneonella sp. CC-YZS046 TaxID=3042152 RepID=UPI002D793B77|nr:DUF6557 family protein [Tsuneonella sp. CC-YZS046]WRO67536.1 DUF6557 family protein [Tsuneonella sp. CC-YZS046]